MKERKKEHRACVVLFLPTRLERWAPPYAAPISLSSETALRPFSLER